MKTILITGAGSGVGREVAYLLKNENLILIDNNEEKLKQVASTIGCNYFVCDIANIIEIENLFNQIQKDYNKIDVLVNSAGLWTKGELSKQGAGHFAEINTLERIKKLIDTNTFGTMAMIKSIVPIMAKSGGGKIININSQSGIIVEEFCPVYNASKTGSRAFSKAIISDLARMNITLTDICPGLIKTDFYNNANDTLSDDIMQTGLEAKDVANVVKYILELPKNITIPSIEIKDIKNY